jgi:hypothetical protein
LGHADFAEMIGSSRPMVSRLIAEMIASKRLSYDGKHYIVRTPGQRQQRVERRRHSQSRLNSLLALQALLEFARRSRYADAGSEAGTSRRGGARLADICNRFTEGFDTADLKDAKCRRWTNKRATFRDTLRGTQSAVTSPNAVFTSHRDG